MYHQLELHNYRNIDSAIFELAPHANLIIAPNGSGKSNLLEAVYVSFTGNPFRSILSSEELIGPQADFARIKITSDFDELEVIITKNPQIRRQYILNGKRTIQRKVANRFAQVLFAPHTVDLVSNEPTGRRQDLDHFLAHLLPEYGSDLNRYNKILRNRNALLKHVREYPTAQDDLQFWNLELVDYSTKVWQARRDFFADISSLTTAIATDLYTQPITELKVTYITSSLAAVDDYHTGLAHKIAQNLGKEIAAGQTLYGVHKDDYHILVDGQDLKYYGSRGQQRIGAFIWKLSQVIYLHNKNIYPLLLIDDLMSELDHKHRQHVCDYLLQKKDIQFILTAADELDVPLSMQEQAQRLSLTA